LRHGRAAGGAKENGGPDPAAAVRWALFFLLALFSTLVLTWVESGPGQPVQALFLTLACAAVAAAAFAAAACAGAASGGSAPGPWSPLLAGAAMALLASWEGYCAWRWVPMTAAIGRLGTGFAGRSLAAGLPLALGASLAVTAAVLLHPDLQGLRLRAAAALLLAWAAPTALTEWRLRSAWGFGPASLVAAAGVPASSAAAFVEVAVLRRNAAGADFHWERRKQAAEGIDASPESLERLAAYLREHAYRGVFASHALAVVRRGWLLWWDADRALEAACLRAPGSFAPDYRTALALIAAGPLTPERFAVLKRLHEGATASSAGFEEVGGAQLAFEAFSAAFARFDDEPRAQYWLGRVGNLWPINEKRIEVTPLQSLRGGVVQGSVLIDGRPASSVRVGLFLETTSEVTRKVRFSLSGAAFPDSAGDFRFEHLGGGFYHLELQGTPEQMRGDILGSPGTIELSEASPVARLEPIRIRTRGQPADGFKAAAEDWLRVEAQGLGGLLVPVGKR
ncbi:MAG: hypothetical protein PHU21_09455, partial [Elusimicrobia bacterium]|nr:hypothetical protein [Elusimicrobiota bacterium]